MKQANLIFVGLAALSVACAVQNDAVLSGSSAAQSIPENTFKEYFENSPAWQQRLQRSTAILVSTQDYNALTSRPVHLDQNLCSEQREQPFSSFAQPSFFSITDFGSCSAVLIDDEFIATAGHCRCEGASAVFGFYKDGNSSWPSIPQEQFYPVAETIVSVFTAQADYAVCRLERPVTEDFTPLPVAPMPTLGSELLFASYPLGTPAKLSAGIYDGVQHMTSRDASWHTVSKRSFVGESGSAVIDSEGRLVGNLSGAVPYALTSSPEQGHCQRFVSSDEVNGFTTMVMPIEPAVNALCDWAANRNRYLSNLDCGAMHLKAM
ncbi:MAG: trypsin-like peptidase domain-containing protein [Myxococcales bacterium]|nr:MAG: trypsin-like peptidase domain-containing protein [Myxococcales bacterium]